MKKKMMVKNYKSSVLYRILFFSVFDSVRLKSLNLILFNSGLIQIYFGSKVKKRLNPLRICEWRHCWIRYTIQMYAITKL